MKLFREQFKECCINDTRTEKKLEKSETVYPACFSKKPITFNTIGWCNKFNDRCNSETCRKLRESL